MPFTLAKITDTPSLLNLDVDGQVTAMDMAEHLAALHTCINHEGWMEQHVYLIVDVRDCNMSFVDVITGAQTHGSDKRGGTTDPLTHAVFLGGGAMIQLLREFFIKISGGKDVPIVESAEEAYQYFQQHFEVQYMR